MYAGTSGWAYPAWKPEFYPSDLPARRFLEYYGSRLNSVEVNYTFRRMPAASTVNNWLAQTEPAFRFSFKAPQQITHMRRLTNCADALKVFCSALAPVLEADRVGLLLFQLPPNFKADVPRLDEFLEMAQGSCTQARLAFEFRHLSWFAGETYETLNRHGAALCVAESDDLETPEVATALFSCYRLRKSAYSRDGIRAVTDRLKKALARGDVFAYFKHEDTPEGALHAEELLKALARP